MKKIINIILSLCFFGYILSFIPFANADEESKPLGDAVATTERAYAKSVQLEDFVLNGVKLTQDRSRQIQHDFENPAVRKCKPFCVQPESMEGATLFRLEDFPKMAEAINSGKILIVDMRTPEWFHKETIPGSINLPYTDISGSITKAKVKMRKLKNKPIIAFCNGWWCGQSHTGINALLRIGYTSKIYWFRGGNQDWSDAGLPFVKP
jgi:rhodanese-related sulfurtransferase